MLKRKCDRDKTLIHIVHGLELVIHLAATENFSKDDMLALIIDVQQDLERVIAYEMSQTGWNEDEDASDPAE